MKPVTGFSRPFPAMSGMALVLLAALYCTIAFAQETGAAPEQTAADPKTDETAVLSPVAPPASIPNLKVLDWPNDEGNSVCVNFDRSDWEADGLNMDNGQKMTDLFFVVEWAENPNGPWYKGTSFHFDTEYTGENYGAFGFLPKGYKTTHYSRVLLSNDDTTLDDGKTAYIRVGIAGGEKMPAGYFFPETASGVSKENFFNYGRLYHLILTVLLSITVLWFIAKARRGISLFIRRIAGLEAVDEAIGRATEMGRSMFYLCGLNAMSDVSTIAATNILGRVAYKVAEYESNLLVPCYDPIVMSVCQEVVQQAYTEAGRPDNYKDDNIFFLTQAQFSYVSSVNAMMMREKPAANFLFGYYYAESLLLAEAGNMVDAIQIAGTDALVQVPFFICACDYTLIGEELYAASAYISREPKLLGSIKAMDIAKAVIIAVVLIGTLLGTIKAFDACKTYDGLDVFSFLFADN